MALLRNDGNANFTPQPAVNVPQAQGGFAGLATYDVDGNGQVDAIGTLPESNLVVVVHDNGNHQLGKIDKYAVAGAPRVVRVADANGDGIADIVTTTDAGVALLAGDGIGGFGSPTMIFTGAGVTDVAVADVDGDGKPDLIVVTPNGAEIDYGDGQKKLISGAFERVVVGDVTGDGRPDLALANIVAGSITVFVNGPAGLRDTGVKTSNLAVSDLVAADIDGDGVTDLLVLDQPGGKVTAFFANQEGALAEGGSVDVGSDVAAALIATNVSGTFLPDFVLVAPLNEQLVVGINTTEPAALPPCAGDCNRDRIVGVDELLVGVDIVLGKLPLGTCSNLILDQSHSPGVNDLVVAVTHLLHGCSSAVAISN
jgi:hypothetical protein